MCCVILGHSSYADVCSNVLFPVPFSINELFDVIEGWKVGVKDLFLKSSFSYDCTGWIWAGTQFQGFAFQMVIHTF